MSTFNQKYSLANQKTIIEAYAKFHNIEIVKTYSDGGRSGLTIRNRTALQKLIADVCNGDPEFNVILVFDVSRWGRFQDIDESAHYEFICRNAGVTIQYCAEQFGNDGGIANSVMKSMKRAMAGEYSRDLSARVTLGLSRIAQLGYHHGGRAPYGLRRVMIDHSGTAKCELKDGQRKYLASDHVILTPGSRHEINIVRKIFSLFVKQRVNRKQIAKLLNAKGILTRRGLKWSDSSIAHILTNQKYIGTLVWNRSTYKLGTKRTDLPRHRWMIRENTIEPIIDRKLFDAAQLLMSDTWRLSNNDLLDYLCAAWCTNGYLSATVINKLKYTPSINTYCDHFGSLQEVYRLIGYKKFHHYRYIDGIGPLLCRLDREITGEIIREAEKVGGCVKLDGWNRTLKIDGQLTIALVLVPYLDRHSTQKGWRIYFNYVPNSDALLLARLNRKNVQILDFHLIPRTHFKRPTFRFTDSNIKQFMSFRLDSISNLYDAYSRGYSAPPGA